MRRTGNPSIVAPEGKHHSLSRVEFSNRNLAEAFLQDSLHKSPQILPVEELDLAFAPLVSLGREIESIDNLFISPKGMITLVETKLWRNPEATREVVAQVLDYAAKLSSWSYSDFESAAKKALFPAPIGGGDTLYGFIAKKYPKDVLPEEQFIDEVQKNLRNARFLLLVVGDGIRENLENILGLLCKQPQMLFTFCLVEIHIYENPAFFSGRLLVPMVIARTAELPRTVVVVETKGPALVSVMLSDDNVSGSAARRRTLSEELFFKEIKSDKVKALSRHIIDFACEVGAELKWCSNSVSIQLPDPRGSKQNLTLFVLTTVGDVYTGWLPGQLEKVSLDKNIAFEYVKALASMFAGITVVAKKPDTLSRAIRASELEPKIESFTSLVRETIKKISEKEE